MNVIKVLPKLRVSISNKCQLHCNFCGGETNKMENFQPDYMVDILSTERLLSIIKLYIENGGNYVQFTGGEPLLRYDLPFIVEKTFEYGGVPEINTNGIALNTKNAKQLKESGINVIKVSIPSFLEREYTQITGVNALSKVLNNVKSVHGIVDIRLNMVATKKSMRYIDLALDMCSKYQVSQLLLLELLFYSHVVNGEAFFQQSYVDIIKDYNKYFFEKLGSYFENYKTNNLFESSLYVAKGKKRNIDVFAKVSNPVWRLKDCESCESFCQEGVYELRLSTGGYLNFCNVVNNFGMDVSKCSSKEIDVAFKKLHRLFFTMQQESGNVFMKHCKMN